MSKTLTVFVCSTYSDLVDEREAVLDGIRKLKLQHDSMEFFGARDSQPLETCLEEVSKSDVLVVIIAHRYGSLVPGQDISFTQAEYEEGIRLGKPCLVYLKDKNIPVLPAYVENDPFGITAIRKFKDFVTKKHTVASFADPNDLAVRVVADLSDTIRSLEEYEKLEKNKKTTNTTVFDEVNELLKEAIDSQLNESDIISALRQCLASLQRDTEYREPLVFLSYASSDRLIVDSFAKGLARQGIKTWFDEKQLTLGGSILDSISNALDRSDFLAFFISEASIQSKWAHQELSIVMAKRLSNKGGGIVLPILLEDVEVPAILRDVKYLDLRDGDAERGVNELVNAIKQHHGK